MEYFRDIFRRNQHNYHFSLVIPPFGIIVNISCCEHVCAIYSGTFNRLRQLRWIIFEMCCRNEHSSDFSFVVPRFRIYDLDLLVVKLALNIVGWQHTRRTATMIRRHHTIGVALFGSTILH